MWRLLALCLSPAHFACAFTSEADESVVSRLVLDFTTSRRRIYRRRRRMPTLGHETQDQPKEQEVDKRCLRASDMPGERHEQVLQVLDKLYLPSLPHPSPQPRDGEIQARVDASKRRHAGDDADATVRYTKRHADIKSMRRRKRKEKKQQKQASRGNSRSTPARLRFRVRLCCDMPLATGNSQYSVTLLGAG